MTAPRPAPTARERAEALTALIYLVWEVDPGPAETVTVLACPCTCHLPPKYAIEFGACSWPCIGGATCDRAKAIEAKRRARLAALEEVARVFKKGFGTLGPGRLYIAWKPDGESMASISDDLMTEARAALAALDALGGATAKEGP